MRMFYFVRHGESVGNQTNVRQGAAGSLTERGKRQAVFLAKRCMHEPIAAIYTSPYPRARETADTIANALKLTVNADALFAERKHPSEILGKHRTDPVVTAVLTRIETNLGRSGWRHSDEETFDDLRGRGRRALAFLETQPDNTLVVTHGYFLRLLTALMMFGDTVTAHEFARWRDASALTNTGLTVCALDTEESAVPRWKLITWNDRAHLGEID